MQFAVVATGQTSTTYFALIGRGHDELDRFTAHSLPLG